MLKTRITELFGIRYPIISAPMVGYSGGSLAAAVSSAGGLRTFGAASSTSSVGPDYVREQIRHIRSQTDQPFGVGFITHYIPVSPRNFEVVLEEAVPVVLFSFAAPEPWLSRAKQSGAITVCQVQTLEAARGAIAAGADVLVAQGNEAGGHTGTMNLLPFLVRLVEEFPSLPIVAAGGLATGRSLAAVLTAGAEGAWMGTVFLATREAQEVSEAHKELIVQSSAEETIYTQVFDIMHTATFNSPPGRQALLHEGTTTPLRKHGMAGKTPCVTTLIISSQAMLKPASVAICTRPPPTLASRLPSSMPSIRRKRYYAASARRRNACCASGLWT